MVSWLAVFAIIIAVFLVYKGQLKHILFDAPGSSGFAGPSTVLPTPGNPNGIAVPQPTPAPPGQPGQYRTDQNGDLYKWLNGQWVPWGTTAPGNQPVGPAAFTDPLGVPWSGVTFA